MFSAGRNYKDLYEAVDLFSHDEKKHLQTVRAIVAANYKNEELIKLFNATNGTADFNPLQMAVWRATNRNALIAELLKLEGLDINIIHKVHGTLLHMAVNENSESAILMLIVKGADPKVRCQTTKGDLTAAELAKVYANEASENSEMRKLQLSFCNLLSPTEKSESKPTP